MHGQSKHLNNQDFALSHGRECLHQKGGAESSGRGNLMCRKGIRDWQIAPLPYFSFRLTAISESHRFPQPIVRKLTQAQTQASSFSHASSAIELK